MHPRTLPPSNTSSRMSLGLPHPTSKVPGSCSLALRLCVSRPPASALRAGSPREPHRERSFPFCVQAPQPSRRYTAALAAPSLLAQSLDKYSKGLRTLGRRWDRPHIISSRPQPEISLGHIPGTWPRTPAQASCPGRLPMRLPCPEAGASHPNPVLQGLRAPPAQSSASGRRGGARGWRRTLPPPPPRDSPLPGLVPTAPTPQATPGIAPPTLEAWGSHCPDPCSVIRPHRATRSHPWPPAPARTYPATCRYCAPLAPKPLRAPPSAAGASRPRPAPPARAALPSLA